MPVNPPVDLARLRADLEREGTPWEMSETSMTELTEDERVLRLGVPAPPELDVAAIDAAAEETRRAVTAARALGVGAPAAFDLRDVDGRDYTTPVKDQGACGSCVAFGVAATMEHVARFTWRAPSLPLDLSEAHLFYCHGRDVGARCSDGWHVFEAVAAGEAKGVTLEDYYPYTSGEQACSNLHPDWRSRHLKVSASRDVTHDAAAMKRHISRFGSIAACMWVFQDFFSYHRGVYRHVDGEFAGGHCITLVGYSDVQRCWIGKNSWGTGWGNRGYFKIRYGQCGIESFESFAVRGVSRHLDRRFIDVGKDHTHFRGITWAAKRGITTGMAHDTFRPEDPVTRGQMATFLVRGLGLPTAAPADFPDVPAGHVHGPAVASLVAAGIATGYADGTFRPEQPVSRGQVASFLARGLGLSGDGDPGFGDVPEDDPHRDAIAALVTAEIASGFANGTFRPRQSVTRAQMATLLMRALRD
jgi:C1A family cysteine protease